MKNKITMKDILFLQAVIIIFTISSIAAKFASGEVGPGGNFLSGSFFLFYGIEIAMLGIYAILWQQVIKKFELSVAYANKAMSLIWSMIWAVLIFHNDITVPNIIGVILVVVGTVILNSGQMAGDKLAVEENIFTEDGI